ncbi:hypothetical protein [Flavobacterium ginsengiterrae]|uniref:hypothetical protein n=1 Tax=Flavobacterium ginsengiterrae TaxID=871695 RepID=UPI0031E96485
MMTKEEAIEELMYQSGTHPDYENQNERSENGFLTQLRPFKRWCRNKRSFLEL